MTYFIIQTLIMLSLAVILYLMAEVLPRISDEPENGPGSRSRAMHYVEKLDIILKTFSERILRQFRVWILKLDNVIGHKLNRFKKEIPKETKLPPAEEENKTPEN